MPGTPGKRSVGRKVHVGRGHRPPPEFSEDTMCDDTNRLIIGPKRCDPRESLFYRMWEHASAEVEAEEAMIAERTDLLEARIAELEAALKVFVDDRTESGCVDCRFLYIDANGCGSECSLPDDDRRPCRMGWMEWAIEEGRKELAKCDVGYHETHEEA